MKDLVKCIAQALVDNPEQVEVAEIVGDRITVLELKVAKETGSYGSIHTDDIGCCVRQVKKTYDSRNIRITTEGYAPCR